MSDDPYEGAAVTPARIGGAAFILVVPVFGYLGHLLFESVAFGGAAGFFVGLGVFLLLPYFLYGAAVREQGIDPPSTDYASRAAIGLGLSTAGIVAIGIRFVVEGAFVLPLVAGAVFAVVDYLLLSRVLPPIEAPSAS